MQSSPDIFIRAALRSFSSAVLHAAGGKKSEGRDNNREENGSHKYN